MKKHILFISLSIIIFIFSCTISSKNNTASEKSKISEIQKAVITGVTVDYSITNDWGSGFTAEVTVINNSGININGWIITWTFPDNQQINNLWNGELSVSGSDISVRNVDFNQNIPDGSQVSFGFQGSYNGANNEPTDFIVSSNSISSSSASSSSSLSSISSSSISSSLSSSSSSSIHGKPIPGKIEAEDWDDMFGIRTEECSEGTLNIGWIDVGDWLEYEIYVNETANYNISFRVACLYDTGKFDLLIDNNIKASLNVPDTEGWQEWTTIFADINLTEGNHILKLQATGSPWNMNWFEANKNSSSSSTSSISSSSISSASSSSTSAFSDDSFDISTITMNESEIRDKIKGGWLGQMAGVAWGFPTEFYAQYIYDQEQLHSYYLNSYGLDISKYLQFKPNMIPYNELPEWHDPMINDAFTQDDLLAEFPFIDAMRSNGVNCNWDALGNSFKNSGFALYHANGEARTLLQNGIQAPYSGHYLHSKHSEDLDWQIEADFTGLMNPGQVNSAIETAWRCGHIVNYGNGVYGGIFVAAMEAKAFTANNINEIIEAGRHSVPVGSEYRQIIEEVIANYNSGKSIQENWNLINNKWKNDEICVEFSGAETLNIEAKFNGAFILMGLLYGNGNFEESMKLSMSLGQDSDCNPSNIGGILGAYYGYNALPGKWKNNLDTNRTFGDWMQSTTTTVDDAVNSNLELARQVVILKGGSAPNNGTWHIPASNVVTAPILEQIPVYSNNPSPNLQINAVKLSGNLVEFSASADDSDGIKDYYWFFGDMMYLQGANGTHTYKKSGTYTAICYVTDELGNTSWKQVTIVIN